MGTSNHPQRLAAAMAIILGTGAAATDAEAQSNLNVYSNDWTGPNQAAPTGSERDTQINMSFPRLNELMRQLRAIEQTLNTHAIPAHPGPPHSHAPPPIDQDTDQDVGDTDTTTDTLDTVPDTVDFDFGIGDGETPGP